MGKSATKKVEFVFVVQMAKFCTEIEEEEEYNETVNQEYRNSFLYFIFIF